MPSRAEPAAPQADAGTETSTSTGVGVGAPVAERGSSVELRGVSHTFGGRGGRGGRQAVDGIDLSIEPGEFVCLVGPSGCGKSTLLNLVAGFLTPTAGSVVVDGRPVRGPGADRGVVFQQPRLFPWMSVRANVEFGPRMRGASRAERRRVAEQTLELVGLADVADRPPYELSGGMQQRAAIARALGGGPRVLLMDEPFAALDAFTRERMQDEILRIWRLTGMTVLFVTHSVDEAVYVGSRVVALSAHPGRVVFDEPAPFAAATDREGVRSRPEFVALRDRVHRVLRAAADA